MNIWYYLARGGAWAHVTACPIAAVACALHGLWPLAALCVFGALVGAYILWDQAKGAG